MESDAAAIAIAALDLPAEEREAHLNAVCGKDARLREEAAQLVAASERADGFLSSLAQRTGLGDESTLSGSTPSQAFGAYQLLRPLGEGGMGSVYLAQRNDAQFEQQVAIKTLPPGFRSGALQARFLQERQILARLNHPNIAGLLDGGVAADGTPFLAMEYVAGQRIDRYCDQQQLTVRERIELFLDVCDGVDYAHRNLVVHRDIKPDNVLVNADGNAKLLDFGIAKLMDDEEAQALTRVTGTPLTPRYASPEQLTQGPANVATDVYALGVLLYELLVGTSPYGAGLQGSTLRTAIIEGNIILPRSAFANLSHADLLSLAELRRCRPTGLKQLLQRDLTSALLKALAPRADSRYESADALARDLRAWLDNRPLSAAGATSGYVLGKFFRRNRLAVISAGLGTLALAGIAVIATLSSIESARQNTLIKAERDRAEQIQSFLLSVFALQSPNETKGAQVSAKELLDRGAERVDAELADQPRARAEIKKEIAAVYGQLGLRNEGEALLRVAAEQQRQEFGALSETYANTLERLAEFVEMNGNYDEALALAEESLTIARRLDNVPLLAHNLVRVARIEHLKGEYQKVKPMYQEAIELQGEYYGEDSSNVAETLMHYGSLLQHLGEHADAEQTQRRALGVMRASFGEDHTMTMSALINLAPPLRSLERYSEALEALDQAHAISTKILGPEHPDNRFIMNHRANTLLGAERFAQADRAYDELAEFVANAMGTSHPDYGLMQRYQGDNALRREEYANALDLYQRADQILAPAMPDSPQYWDMKRRMAHCQRQLGQLETARATIDDAVTAQRRILGTDHRLTQSAIAEAITLSELTGDAKRLATLKALRPAPSASR